MYLFCIALLYFSISPLCYLVLHAVPRHKIEIQELIFLFASCALKSFSSDNHRQKPRPFIDGQSQIFFKMGGMKGWEYLYLVCEEPNLP